MKDLKQIQKEKKELEKQEWRINHLKELAKEKAIEILKDKSVYDDDYFEFIHKALDIAIQESKKEVIDELKDNFPKTLQPLGTKKETMIPKWKAIKAIGLLINKLEKRHLLTLKKQKETKKQ